MSAGLATLCRHHVGGPAVAVALCLVSSLGAARMGPASTQNTPTASDVRLTVIGCVQRSAPTVVETLGTTAIPEGETRYVLSNIILAGEKDRAETAGAGSSPGKLVSEAVKRYRLDVRRMR